MRKQIKSYFKLFKRVKNQTGVSAVIVAIVLTMLLGFAALAIDVGYIYATRNELQNVADASALAATGYMGSTYEALSYSEQQTYEFVRSDIVTAANDVAQKNKAGNENIGINDSDVTIGTWNADTETLTPMASPLVGPDAVRIIARRDGSANLPITTFFARIFGITDVNVVAQATAALTGPAIIAEGVLKTPFALSESNLADCTELITFYPTASSCAAWHNFFDPMNAATVEAKMLGLIQGDVQTYPDHSPPLVNGPDWLAENFDIADHKTPDALVTPEVETGDEFTFQGGTIGSLFLGGALGNKDNDINLPEEIIGQITNPAPFPALFDYFRRRDGDGDDSVWTATIPIYEEEPGTCENPNQSIPIVGFSKIEVYMPTPPPEDGWKTVHVLIDCQISYDEGRGGGGTSGNIKGTIANLVE